MFSRNTTKRKDQPSTLFSIVAKPIAELSIDQILNREIALRTRAIDYNLFSSVLSQLPADVSSNDFENLIDECNEILAGKNDSLNQIRTVYPPQFPNYSNLILTKNYHSQFYQTESLSSPSHNQDEQIFMQLLKNAYSNDLDMNSGQQGLMRCNIILKDISEIHSFEFEKELDYWKFIATIHQGIDEEFVNYKGRCKYITGRKSGNREVVKEKEKEKKKFSITMSAFTGLGSNNMNNSFNDSFELRDNGVFCRTNSSEETVILFRDIIALALNLDHRLPFDYVMHVGIRLPAGYFRVVKSELTSLELQFASTNSSDKRTIHAAEQLGNGALPFETIDTHTALIPLPDDILGIKAEIDSSPQSTTFFGSPTPTYNNKELSPLTRSVSQVKGVWEFEVYSDRINGKLLGKKTLLQNPFLETVNPKSFDADMRKILLNMNNPNPQMMSSSLSAADSYANAETSPFSQFSSFGRSRGKSLRMSSPPPLHKKDSECESPKPSPKRYTSINFNSGMNATANINPNAVSYNSSLKSFLRCNDTKRYDLDLVQKQFHKALRVFVRSASGLGGGGGRKGPPPSAYCTVYLVGKNQERLTANHTDVRTENIKSVDPEWNKEILLQDQNLGIDEVQAVMVLVRDAASGFLKHKHLGQVTVPIDCFLPQDEAAFCLPLEPSYRMDGKLAEQSFLGHINLTTQLVNVESVEDSTMNLDDIYLNSANEDMTGASKREEKRRPSINGAPAASTKQRQLFVRTKSVELINAQLICTLHRSCPSSTWWPIKILQISCLNKFRSTPSVNYHGFLLLNPHGVLLKVNFPLQASETVTSTTETPSFFMVGDLLRKSKEYVDPHISIPYLQVESATVLSSSCLFLTIQLHNSNNNTTSSRFTLEILCGPCKAQEVSQLFALRQRSGEVYRELTSIESKNPTLHPLPTPSRTDSKRFVKSGLTSPQSPSKQIDGGFAFFSDNVASKEWVASVKSIIRNLEAQHVQLATTDRVMERAYVRVLFHLLRLFYIPNLLIISNDITPSHFLNDSIRIRIQNLMDQATTEAKTLQANGKDLDEDDFLIARLSIFQEKALVDFYQSLIFLTPRVFMNLPSTSLNQDTFFAEQIKPFIETFLTVVHQKFQENLKEITAFLSLLIDSSTKDLAVTRKRKWIKFFVEKNDYLQERFLTILTLFHPCIYSIDPNFVLLPTSTILDSIHKMYQDHLKGLQSSIAGLFRQGSNISVSSVQGKGVRSNYNWTVLNSIDGFQVSSIPENVQKILETLVDFYNSLKQTPITYSSAPSITTTSSTTYLKLCKKLLLVIYNAWLFVGHEYYSATHFYYLNVVSMKKNIKSDYVADLSLFIANLNDCSRIMSDYFPVLRDMTHKLLVTAPTCTLSANLENGIMKSLQDESYDIIVEQLLLIISRLIFTPVVQSFLLFDELCFKVSGLSQSSSNPPPSRFISTVCEKVLMSLTKVKAWFRDPSLYRALIYLVEETIINRYLLFIRDAVASTANGSSAPLHQLTREEVIQFQSDFSYLKSTIELVSADLPPGKVGQEKGELLITYSMEWVVPPLQYFEHLVNLLACSIESYEFNSSLRFLLTLTEVKSTASTLSSSLNQLISTFLEFFLLHIIMPLHTESNDMEQCRYQKENLFSYLMNFLDGNYEVIYRRTNEFCPINIQPHNHHTNFNSSSQQSSLAFGEDLPSNLRRDLLWRMFSPYNMHNSGGSTKSSINQPSSRGSTEALLSLPDALQNPFKGLFTTNNSSSRKVPPSGTNHSSTSAENRNVRNSGKFSSPNLIGSTTVENVRQTATDWIQKMTFIPKKGDSAASSKKEYKEKVEYDENTIFDAIGLEVFYSETIVSMEEAQNKTAHINDNINDKASNSNSAPTNLSSSSKNNQAASGNVPSSAQTPVRTVRQDSSGKSSLFHLFTGSTGPGGPNTSSKHNHPSSTAKKKNPGVNLMTENKEEPIYDSAMGNSLHNTPHHAPPTPSVQQTLHFFEDNEANTPATTVLSSNRGGQRPLTLTISQVHLSGIHTSSIFSKANPYVYFLMPSLQVKVKTSLLHNANQGNFADVIKIPLPANSDIDNQTLTVEVYDKEKIRRKILLGWNSLRLAPYTNSEEAQLVELPLVSPDKSSAGSSSDKEFGKISFSVQFIVS